MKYIKLIIITIVILINSIVTKADDGKSQIKDLFKNTNLIITGQVVETEMSKENYKIFFQIDEVIYGQIGENKIIIETELKNGLYKSNENYLSKDEKYLLFLSSKGKYYKITNNSSGVFSYKYKDDIKLLLNQFTDKNNMFALNNKNKIKNLYSLIESEDIKSLVLNELKNITKKEDLSFIDNLFNSRNINEIVFALNMYGELKLEEKRSTIELKLQKSNQWEIVFYSIATLGELASAKSIEPIAKYLNNKEQSIRRVAIEALGKIKESKNINLLKEAYINEEDWGNRTAIIEMLIRLAEKNEANKILNSFLIIENNNFLREFIKECLAKN